MVGSFRCNGGVALTGAVAVFLTLLTLLAGSQKLLVSDCKEDGSALGWGIENKLRFVALCLAVFLDTAIQAGFLTFLAFFIAAKDVSLSVTTLAVTFDTGWWCVGKSGVRFSCRTYGHSFSFHTGAMPKRHSYFGSFCFGEVPRLRFIANLRSILPRLDV